jgi:hypothetical protein
MPSSAELKTVGDDSCSTLEEEEPSIVASYKTFGLVLSENIFKISAY